MTQLGFVLELGDFMSIRSSSWVSFETQISCTEVGLCCRHP